jgi:hypothetical protein
MFLLALIFKSAIGRDIKLRTMGYVKHLTVTFARDVLRERIRNAAQLVGAESFACHRVCRISVDYRIVIEPSIRQRFDNERSRQ